jgi:hypothetical protein
VRAEIDAYLLEQLKREREVHIRVRLVGIAKGAGVLVIARAPPLPSGTPRIGAIVGVATAPAWIRRGCLKRRASYGPPTVAHQASAEGVIEPDLMYREPKRSPIVVNPR